MKQPKIKALFFDIDGTLVSFKTHKIPASTTEALERAKANGVEIYISTGRPTPLITVLGDIEHLIDGYITANGAYCFAHNEDVCLHAIPANDVETMVEAATRQHFFCVLVGTKNLCIYQPDEKFQRIFVDMLQVKAFEQGVTIDEILKEPILQMSPFITPQQEEALMQKLTGCLSGRWHPEFTDVTSRWADKGQGLHAMARHLDFSMEETMAFGDGGNDISIIEQAAVGVAMGNSVEELKKVADYVTTSVDEDGVKNALERYGVI